MVQQPLSIIHPESTLMSNPATVTISVPATTANIGPGFDCLGAALSLYNRFTFSHLSSQKRTDGVSEEVANRTNNPPALIITAHGEEADRVQTDASNLAYQAFCNLYQFLGQPIPAVQLEIELGVPLARGLGSSATAIVGGLVGANVLAGSPLSSQQVLELAVAMEGHPDNVVPALLGGCRLAATKPTLEIDSGWEICDIPWHPAVVPIVAIPNFELSTAEARRVLPTDYSRADAIFNTAHLGLLVRGLETGNGEWLRGALQDRIHQPYRQTLIPGYGAVQQAAIAAGAYGLVISGAGPTLLALAKGNRAESIRAEIAAAWANEGIAATVKVLQIDHQGARTEN
jgi:homoserine kinase